VTTSVVTVTRKRVTPFCLMKPLTNLKSSLITVFIFAALLGAVQLVLANSMSTEGQKIRELEERKGKLENEIQALEKDVSTLGALSRVQPEAEKLGLFYNSQALEYLSPPKLAQVP